MILSYNSSLSTNLLKISEQVKLLRPENYILTDDQVKKRAHYEKDIKSYLIDFWDEAGTNNGIIPDISLECVAEHMKALMDGEFKTLLFVMPPRQGKSTLFSVMFPAYLWLINPSTRMLTSCYAKDYAYRDNYNMQQLIKSKLYQQYWGEKFSLTTVNQSRTRNDKNGARIATSIFGRNVGEGGEYVLLDDVNQVAQMHSPTMLENTNRIVSNILVTRQNMPSKTKFVIAQHRCSHLDAIGSWLSKNDKSTCYVNLPMEYEIKRRSVSVSLKSNKIIWADPRKKEGELLAPLRYDSESIEFLKTHMGKAAYSALYQGNPTMDEAAIFKEEWFRMWSYPFAPPITQVIQSWDTAISTSVDSCYSSCTTWGLFKDTTNSYNMILLNKWSGKKEWTELRQMMLRLAFNYNDLNEEDRPTRIEKKPDIILVEAKANGGSLIQSLARAGVNCVKYNPPRTNKNDKTITNFEDAKAIRARLIAPIVESGRVWVKAIPPSFEDPYPSAKSFIKACVTFPSSAFDSRDVVDTFTMTVDWLQRQGKLYTLDDIIGRQINPFDKYDNKSFNLTKKGIFDVKN